ncbi:hypothetical protein GCM10025790_22490 [Nesterenkonia rhizosphaerae]|uniref:Uncharacterized protein n=1 Tax=Nesterenkonia rhizosphaerae TaxID=1348272 RepID=A0ABP9G130_9MICC
MPGFPKSGGEGVELGGFARSIWAFKGDENTASCWCHSVPFRSGAGRYTDDCGRSVCVEEDIVPRHMLAAASVDT